MKNKVTMAKEMHKMASDIDFVNFVIDKIRNVGIITHCLQFCQLL
jgi:endonuclease IV